MPPTPPRQKAAGKRKAGTDAGPAKKRGKRGEGSSTPSAKTWFSFSKGGEEISLQQERREEVNKDPAPKFQSVDEMKLNFPFSLPGDINEGRTEVEVDKVKKVLEEAHHAFLERQIYLDNFIRDQMEKYGSMYTLGHQIRAIGNSAEKWIKTVVEWHNEEKKARTASEAELAKMVKTKNPLVKLLLSGSETEPEPPMQAENVEVEEDEEEEELVVKRRRKGKMVVEEDPENDEEQFFMAELDTYMPVDMMEFAFGETTGRGEQLEEQGEISGLDELFNVPIIPEVSAAQSAGESVQVEVGNVPDEARVEEIGEREPGAQIE